VDKLLVILKIETGESFQNKPVYQLTKKKDLIKYLYTKAHAIFTSVYGRIQVHCG